MAKDYLETKVADAEIAARLAKYELRIKELEALLRDNNQKLKRMTREQKAKELQQEQQRRRAAESLEVVSQAAAAMAHRVANIAGLGRLNVLEILHILEDVPLKNNDREYIEKKLRNIEQTIRSILELAEILRKPFKPMLEGQYDINSLLDKALNLADLPSTVTVQRRYADNLPSIQMSELLVEVFIELITNARKAMAGRDKQELAIESRLTKDGRWIEIRFADTGCGIPEENRDHIGRLFYKTGKSGEYGFGLWWVRTFLEQQGGSITFESEVGKRTTFIVRLPAMDTHLKAEEMENAG